jgi:hypothetical protein
VTPPRFRGRLPSSALPLSTTGAVSPELPAFCNRDDHLVRTLVAARCSALYFLTNFVSSIAFGNHNVF